MNNNNQDRFFYLSPDLMCTIDKNGYFQQINPAWESILGYKENQLIGEHFADLAHPEDLEITINAISQIIAQIEKPGKTHQRCSPSCQLPISFENRYLCQNNTYKWLSWRLINERENQLIYGIARDITATKNTELALRQAEAKYRKIYENATEGIFQSTYNGQYISANPAIARIYGYSSPEELINKLTDIGHQLYVDPERRSEFIHEIHANNKVTNFESQIYRADGTIIWIKESASAVYDEAGNFLYYQGIVEDITDHKQVELARKLSDERLKQQQSALMLLALSQSIYMGEVTESWQVITQTAAETIGVSRASIWLYSHFQIGVLSPRNRQTVSPQSSPENKLICVDLYELATQKHTSGKEIEVAKYSTYLQCLENQRIIAASDTQNDVRIQEIYNCYLEPLGISSLLDTPIRLGGEVIGVLSLEQIGTNRTWAVDEQNFLDFLAYMTALSIESHQRTLAESELEQSLALLKATLQSSMIAEAELEKSISLLKATLESTADGIIVIDSNSNLVNCNQKFIEMWHIPPEIANKKDYNQVINFLNDQLRLPHNLLSCFAKSQEQLNSESYDILELKDGRIFERYSQKQPILTNPNIRHTNKLNYVSTNHYTSTWVWSFRDITERRKVERLKNEFVSMVSHELRTPLTSIKGSLGLIAGGVVGTLPPQLKSLIDIALKNSERLVLLINDILDIEKIESGKMAFHIEPFELTPLVEQAIEANRSYGEQFNVTFVFTEKLPEVKVKADSDRIMQVITNLLSNAAKFSPPNETVTVAIKRNNNNLIRLEVTDRGNGIPEAFRSRIFQKFAQADSSDTRQKGGSGLGLSICRAIIERLGGKIDFTTEINVGTTFYFDLPEFVEVKIDPRITNSEQQESRSRLLICEDDFDIATLLKMILKTGGFSPIDIAQNATTAKQLLNEHEYAAMTLDLAMPDQDGLSLIRELRAQEKYQDLPIVVISAKAQEGRKELSGGGLAVIDWLDKPIDQKRLIAAVKQATQRPDSKAYILHIEDDFDLQKVVSVILQDVAHLVHAKNIEDARQKLADETFDLVLLDLGLPDGYGVELLSEINSPDRPPIPVVVFSAQELSADLAREVAATLIKSRTSNQSLLDTIKSLIVNKLSSLP